MSIRLWMLAIVGVTLVYFASVSSIQEPQRTNSIHDQESSVMDSHGIENLVRPLSASDKKMLEDIVMRAEFDYETIHEVPVADRAAREELELRLSESGISFYVVERIGICRFVRMCEKEREK